MFGLFRPQSLRQQFETLDPAPRVSPRDERRNREYELREFEREAAAAWREAIANRKQRRKSAKRTERWLAAEEAFLARATAEGELTAQLAQEHAMAAARRLPRP